LFSENQSLTPAQHTLIEKPISIDVSASKPVVTEAEAHPELKVMVGFSRRCEWTNSSRKREANSRPVDASYQEAKKRIDAGQLGTPYLIKSCTNDSLDRTDYFINYAKTSGGIFMDCGIHDIDIGRWLLDVNNKSKLSNPNKQVTSVFATGLNIRYPELASMGDCDNAIGVIEFENGSKFNIHLSRTSIHGHDVICEVFGVESKLVINSVRIIPDNGFSL
jgi:myo-inositol 2-dehydrogenase/D-chiro-inositol 1-dehydrogenase